MDDRLALRPSEAARRLGLSERTVRGLISRGELKVVRIGRRVLVTPEGLAELLELGPRSAA